jgi:hypothetical protein
MKIILINGAPYSGKDTAAAALENYWTQQDYSVLLERFSMPIKRAFAGTMSLTCDYRGIVEPWERRKESKISELGVSYRQFQIDFSEKFMKPLYGVDVFADLLCTRIIGPTMAEKDYLIVIPDCGFQAECDVIYEMMSELGILNNLALIKLTREGTRWDSRQPVDFSDVPFVRTFEIQNNEDVTSFEHRVIALTEDWIRQ